jgi:hypothetical protein
VLALPGGVLGLADRLWRRARAPHAALAESKS